MKKRALISIAMMAAMLGVGGCYSGGGPQDEPEEVPQPAMKTYPAYPDMVIDTAKEYTATITTVKGDLVLELFAADVPLAVNNFVFLARDGYYNGCTFHRVIPGFMAQGGDPTGTGRGGPGYRFSDEITEHIHVKGALSMANSGPNTNGSQFFITYGSQHYLDGGYSVFGQLVEGMDVLESLTSRDPSENPDYKGDAIIRVTIEEK